MLKLALIAAGLAVALVAAALLPAKLGQAVIPALFVCLAAYTGANFTPRPARAIALSLCLGLMVSLRLVDVADVGPILLIYGLTLLVIVEGLSRLFSRLRVDATTDALTGLRNRLGLLEECERAIAVCRRMGQPISVVHIDLDGFKEVNDRAGHAEGDRILIRCAQAWRREVRGGDILARIGGDEFLVVLPGSDKANAERLVRRLIAVSPIEWCSGIARLGADESITAALARADRELYAAKAASRTSRRGRSQGASNRATRAQAVVRDAGVAFG